MSKHPESQYPKPKKNYHLGQLRDSAKWDIEHTPVGSASSRACIVIQGLTHLATTPPQLYAWIHQLIETAIENGDTELAAQFKTYLVNLGLE